MPAREPPHDILSILDRPEHPVAVHLQLALVGADQARERLLIARPGQCQQPRRLRRIRAAHHPVVS